MKKYFLVALLGALIVSGSALAQTAPADTATPPAATVTSATEAEAKPGILPSSPFYFLKEWRRSIQRTFSFGAEAKANTELKIADEKAVELKTVEEKEPQNTAALTKVLANYQATQERLKAHFEALKQDSNNPNIDKLIEKFANSAVKHEELFKNLIQKAGDKEEIRQAVEANQGLIEDVAAVAATKSEAAQRTIQKIQEKIRFAGTSENYCNRLQAKIAELNQLFSDKKITSSVYEEQKKILEQAQSNCPATPTPSTNSEVSNPENQVPMENRETKNSQTGNSAPTGQSVINSIKSILPNLKLREANTVNKAKEQSQPNSGTANTNSVKPTVKPTPQAAPVFPTTSNKAD